MYKENFSKSTSVTEMDIKGRVDSAWMPKRMSAYIKLSLYVVFFGILIFGAIHSDNETVWNRTMWLSAILGLVGTLGGAVRLLIRKGVSEKCRVKSFDMLFYVTFVGMLIYSIICWDDENSRYEMISLCAFLGVIDMLYGMCMLVIKLFFSKHIPKPRGLELDYRKQSEKEIMAMREEVEALTTMLEKTKKKKDELEKQLEATNKNRVELERQLAETNKNKDNLEQQLEEQKAKLNAAIENKAIKEDAQRRKMLQSKAYAVAKTRLEENKPLSDKDWETMEKELCEIYADFKNILYEAYSLTKLECHICWLVKMGFKNMEVAILVSRAPNAVSLSRKRLYSKVTEREGTASDFNEIIKKL